MLFICVGFWRDARIYGDSAPKVGPAVAREIKPAATCRAAVCIYTLSGQPARGEMPQSNTNKNRITWTREKHTGRAITLDKSRRLQTPPTTPYNIAHLCFFHLWASHQIRQISRCVRVRTPEPAGATAKCLKAVWGCRRNWAPAPGFHERHRAQFSTKVAAQSNPRHAATFQMPKIINVKI